LSPSAREQLRTFKDNQAKSSPEGTLDHTAGNQFREKRVAHGDFIYVISNLQSRVYLVGRLRVKDVLSQAEAERHFSEELWQADDHIRADPQQLTETRYDREVPTSVLRQLTFIASGKTTKVRFNDGHLDQQTLRAVRELTPQAASILDGFVQPVSDTDRTSESRVGAEGEMDNGESGGDGVESDISPSGPGPTHYALPKGVSPSRISSRKAGSNAAASRLQAMLSLLA